MPSLRIAAVLSTVLVVTACSSLTAPVPENLWLYRQTSPGADLVLSSHTDQDLQCHDRAAPAIRIEQQPLHGHIEVQKADVPADASSSPTGIDCPAHMAHGTQVHYVPDLGFVGIDSVRYWVAGSLHQSGRYAVIDVKPGATAATTTHDAVPVRAYDTSWVSEHCSVPHLRYPERAARAFQEGEIILGIRINDSPHPTITSVLRSSGTRALDDEAISAVTGMTCRSDGAMHPGVQTIRFALTRVGQDDARSSTPSAMLESRNVQAGAGCHIAPPRYPRDADRYGVAGSAWAAMTVDTQGRLISYVLWGSGSDSLDRAISHSLDTAYCDSVLYQGRPTWATFIQPFTFDFNR